MATFDDIVGQEQIKNHLHKALTTGQISHAYIINGERSAGKEFIAKIFAMALQCENREQAQQSGEKIPKRKRNQSKQNL